MFGVWRRFRIFLGPERLRALLILLAVTGGGNIALNFFGGDLEWATAGRSALAAIFLVGAAIIIGGRMDSYDRGRWSGILFPAFGAVILGVAVVPQYQLVFLGLAFGWIVASLFLMRPRGPIEYQRAVKHLRKNEYADAVKAMDGLIKEEPKEANHYRFRAEVLRIWGKLDRARRDYEQMLKLDPENPVAHNGLAEVQLQAGHYDKAHAAALKAYELAPGEWVAAYNLGMIEDRLKRSEDAVTHLMSALDARVPDARHRLLIHFYLARAHARLGDDEAARASTDALKRERSGLKEWRTILESDQADTLRRVLQPDIDAAEALMNDQMQPEALAE